MQFGRTFGLPLIVLGVLLFGLQAALVVTPRNNSQGTETANAERRTIEPMFSERIRHQPDSSAAFHAVLSSTWQSLVYL
jgi:hypothetical protein